MEYKLIKADKKDAYLLKRHKLDTILQYAKNLDDNELQKIKKYIDTNILKQLQNYKLIITKGKVIGSLLVVKHKDGYLLDEIYLEENFRNKGIGTNIIKNILIEKNIVYLWTYKDNIKAIKLYLKFGFEIKEETETRYFMKFVTNKNL